jgi:hypothetical protein
MKSVDRDFAQKGYDNKIQWITAVVFVAGGLLLGLMKFWEEVHLRGLSFDALLDIVGLPLMFISPLIIALRCCRRYNRRALKENLVSERVATTTNTSRDQC